MTEFALLPSAERRLILEQVAAKRGILPVIIEKDFWVCWVLHRIFETPEMGPDVVFKGGTSLSKVFNAIKRFSEDADLSVTPGSLGFKDTDLNEAPSASMRQKRMKALAKACEERVAQRFQPALEVTIAAHLGSTALQPWLRYEIDPQAATPNLWFRYPSSLPQAGGYIAKQVKLELGALTNQQPTGNHVIQPLLAEVLGQAFDDFQVPVVALGLERTFWEKATILHAEYHRPEGQPLRDRVARHYSDLAALWRHPGRAGALASLGILRDVVQHKTRFFASSWASYDTARPGSFHLVPPLHRLRELARDHEAMRPMFLGEEPSFEDLVQQLRENEDDLNAITEPSCG
ncbi:MAG: nucleotidyl transferase AbiEii/AbiGii toxin family protein [Holophaga sp.]|nr:nucleotidyl transferase AbiEii/AbiGii toxin family protein [Holophaga sp.]